MKSFTRITRFTFKYIVGVARRSANIHTVITNCLQFSMVHIDRERIGKTMTTNL